MAKLTLKDLKDHLEKYKDALLIIGNKAVNSGQVDYEILTNRNLRRNPEVFWEHYNQEVLTDDFYETTEAQEAVLELYKKGLVKDVVNLTLSRELSSLIHTENKIDSSDIINLHGIGSFLRCTACGTKYSAEERLRTGLGFKNIDCEICGKILRPDILLNKESYLDDQFNALRHLLLETHTLFVVGIDWGEQAIVDLIADYSDMKQTRNATEEEQRMIVIVGSDDYIDPKEVGLFEFHVPDEDIDSSMMRLIEKLKES